MYSFSWEVHILAHVSVFAVCHLNFSLLNHYFLPLYFVYCIEPTLITALGYMILHIDF